PLGSSEAISAELIALLLEALYHLPECPFMNGPAFPETTESAGSDSISSADDTFPWKAAIATTASALNLSRVSSGISSHRYADGWSEWIARAALFIWSSFTVAPLR